MLRSFASDWQGSDVDAADVRSARSHLYCRDSGDYGRHADGDVELVRSGVDRLEDVLAADVSVARLEVR